jgi:hypothetical protein
MKTIRKLVLLLLTAIVALGFGGRAQAELLNWEGTSILRLGDFAPQNIPGGGVATVNGSGGLGHLGSARVAASRGNIQGTFTQFVTDPDTAGNFIVSIQYLNVAGGTGTVGPISGAIASTNTTFQGTIPVTGLVRLCLLSTECTEFGALNLSTHTVNSDVIGIGVGGLLTFTLASGFARLSVGANPWQIKQTTLVDHQTTPINFAQEFVGITFKGWAHGPGSGVTNTATPGGVVQLISPSQVRTNLPNGSNAKVAAVQRLLIRFIPEPGLLLLLGSGVVGLGLLGRKRMRK